MKKSNSSAVYRNNIDVLENYKMTNQLLNDLIFMCISGIRSIENLTPSELIYRLLVNSKSPLTIDDILMIISNISNITRIDIDKILSTNPLYKQVGYHVWALTEWNRYEKIITNFNELIEYAKKDFGFKAWDCFISYSLNNENQTYNSIGKRYNITRERVRQLIKNTIHKLNSKYKNHIEYYIKLLQEQISKSNCILIDDYSSLEYSDLIYNSDIRLIVTFLNIFDGNFYIYKNKYLCSNNKIKSIINMLEEYCSILGDFEVKEISLDNLVNDNCLADNIYKEILIDYIKQDKRYLISKDEKVIFYKKNNISSFDIVLSIANKLNEAFDYSKLESEYFKLIGKGLSRDYIIRCIKMDNNFVELHDNIYILNSYEVNDKLKDSVNKLSLKQINQKDYRRKIVDDVVYILSEHNRIMHCNDIYLLIKGKTNSSKQHLCSLLDKDNRIEKMIGGYYRLKK